MDHLTDDHFCSLMAARCKAVVISLDYRLCPEHAFAPIEDAEGCGITFRKMQLR